MLELEQPPQLSAADKSAGRPRRRLLRALRARPLTLVGAVLVGIFAVLGVWGPALAPHDPAHIFYDAVQVAPSRAFPFGTDDNGRDMLSRVLAGTRISLSVGVGATAIATIAGGVLGLFAGYLRGWVDSIIMRLMDVMLAFPDVLLAIVVITILGPGEGTVTVAVGVATIPAYTRTVRAATLTVRDKEYVEAARALGATPLTIIFRHVLRNVATPVVVLATLSVGLSIITVAGLSFIGLGVQPPAPEWGDMLNEAQNYLQQAWWMAVFPGVALMLCVIGLNLLGDGLRQLLDPRLR